MSALNKLNRAFDSLRKVNIQLPHDANRQKFKLTPCLTITELVCKSNEKTALLPFAITSLVQLLENADSNTRLVIDESLNKIIRSSLDNSNHIAKILIALIKILGKSTNERSLRAALWRFAKLSHYIRPQKGKVYLKTLMPIFVKLATRKEESVHETLAESLPNIFQHIGLFTTNNDVRAMLKRFFRNLSSDSVEIRRAAASCIITICELSRKPEFFFSYSTVSIIDFLFDSQILDDSNKLFVQGCLSCLRQMLPSFIKCIRDPHSSASSLQTEKLLQVYELCLFYAKFQDHNVITSALETLHQLLKHGHPAFISRLTMKGGLAKSTTLKKEKHGSTLSLSAYSDVLSIGSTIAHTEDGFLFGELPPAPEDLPIMRSVSGSCLDLNTELKEERTEKWVSEQLDGDNDSTSSSSLNMDASHFANSDEEMSTKDENDLSYGSRALSIDNISSVNEYEMSSINSRIKNKFKSLKSLPTTSIISESMFLNIKSTELDIGGTANDDVPLDHCARFLVSMFLLEEPNEHVRVSVMSLALTCLRQVWRIYPNAALISVEKSKPVYENYRNLLEVVICRATHDDHQIRGYVNIAVAHFIASFLIKNHRLLITSDDFELERHLSNKSVVLLQSGLEDESSICVRHTLHAISICLNSLLQSCEYKFTLSLLEMIFVLAENPYWLIKIKILEIIQEIHYEQLFYLTKERAFQDRIFEKIIIVFLGDSDGRVRNATAHALAKFVKKAYYPLDHYFCSVVVTAAKNRNLESLPHYLRENENEFLLAEQRSLMRVVHRLYEILSSTCCRNVTAGCCEALAVLVAEYPPCTNIFGWQCFDCETSVDNSYSPLVLCENILSLLTNSMLIVNFDVHLSILKVISQLFTALCSVNVKSKKVNFILTDGIWSSFNEYKLSHLAESFFQHVIRLANIFNDIVINANVKPLTPVKWHKNTLTPLPIDDPLLLEQRTDISLLRSKQPKRKNRFWREGKHSFSQYNHSTAYMKLREALKSAFMNYEVTLKPESSEKFVTFLRTILDILSAILDFTTTTEIDRICKDLLNYLRNFIVFLPVESVRCVKVLLKSVFGTNFLAKYSQCCKYGDNHTDERNEGEVNEFFENVFQNPANKMSQFMQINEKVTYSTKDKEKSEIVSPSTPHAKRSINLNMLPSYIKLIEPNVIQALRVYTVTSDAQVQAEVLFLLSELIQLRINYCLLDSEQIFIKFVLSQFQLIEEEQLPNMNTLLPAMFDFLIHLANEKHSKPVMSIPKVIQLCDSLIAGIQAAPHCVAAMKLVVRHVFLKSSFIADTDELKELETQRDVLLAMLLKLSHNPRTFSSLTLILNHSDEEAKLKRSNQIFENLLRVLEEQKIIDVNPTYTSTRLLNLLLALHPGSYSVELLWRSALNICHTYSGRRDVTVWLPLFTPFLILLLTKCSENQILDAVNKGSNHVIFSDNEYEGEGASDPLCVSVLHMTEITPTRAFAKILLDNAKQILRELMCRDTSNLEYRLQLLSELALIISYIRKSGRFENIQVEFDRREKEKSDFAADVDAINQSLRELWMTCPITVLRWWDLIYDGGVRSVDADDGLPKIIGDIDEYNLSRDMIKMGLFLLACYRQRESFADMDTLNSFLQENFNMLLLTTKEVVVRDVLTRIQKVEDASRVLIEVIGKCSLYVMKQNIQILRMLECLKYCHEKTAGQRLKLYCQLDLFSFPCIVITNYVIESVTEIVDYFETVNDEEDFKQHLDISSMERILEALENSKNSNLRSLTQRLYRLAGRWYGTPVPSISNADRQLDFDRLQGILPDRKWFFDFLKNKCCNPSESRYLKMAAMLNRLNSEDASKIMNSPNFNYKILPYCFLFHSHRCMQKWPLDSTKKVHKLSELYLTAKLVVYQNIKLLISRLPKNHQVYEPVKRDSNEEELRYSRSLDAIFSHGEFVDRVRSLIPAVNAYAQSVTNLRSLVDVHHLLIDSESFSDVANFAALCLELSHWLVKKCGKSSKSTTAIVLECCASILEIDEILNIIAASHIGSLISALYVLVESHTRDIVKFKKNPVFERIPEDGRNGIHHSAHIVSVLTEYFLTKSSISTVDDVLYRCKKLLIALCRSPLVYDYVRIPLELWKHVDLEDVVTKSCLTLNSIPEHFLQDCDILQNFVCRLMFLGWNYRTQFEECWMSLLTALNSLPEQDLSEEEQQALSQVCAVTISAVTSLLVQTLYFPVPGRKTCPHVLHISRNTFQFNKRRWKSKLAIVNNELTQKVKIEGEKIFSLFDNVDVNVERLHDKNKYGFNQISVEYLLFPGNMSSTVEDREDISNIYKWRQKSIENIGIDTNSCVYFLMDFYSRWLLKPGEPEIQTLLEIVNSLIVMSDLFTEVTQFVWLLDCGIDLWKKYSRLDDSVLAYVVVIICKAASVFAPLETDSKRMVVRVLKTGLASNSIAVQTASLQGLLYLLERIFKRDILNQEENIDGSFQDEILSAAINYVLENLDVDLTETCEEKTIYCVISVSYYLIEHKICGENTGLIIDRFIKLSVRACKMKSWKIYTTIIQGLFNLILAENAVVKKFDNELSQLVKEILSTVACDPPASLLSLQMLIASLYSADDVGDTSSDDVFDSEKLVTKMEKISVFFERIKKCRRVEAKLICSVLPQILNDLFPPSEILNKVILEFLSPHQPHPDLLAEVVYRVFQNAIQQSQLSLIQDWVLSLLNNFSNCPKLKAVYYLTCFFISACANIWLTALYSFPALQISYNAEKECESRELLCIAAAQFYSELADESQKQKFVTTFEAADLKLSDDRFKGILKTVLPKRVSN